MPKLLEQLLKEGVDSLINPPDGAVTNFFNCGYLNGFIQGGSWEVQGKKVLFTEKTIFVIRGYRVTFEANEIAFDFSAIPQPSTKQTYTGFIKITRTGNDATLEMVYQLKGLAAPQDEIEKTNGIFFYPLFELFYGRGNPPFGVNSAKYQRILPAAQSGLVFRDYGDPQRFNERFTKIVYDEIEGRVYLEGLPYFYSPEVLEKLLITYAGNVSTEAEDEGEATQTLKEIIEGWDDLEVAPFRFLYYKWLMVTGTAEAQLPPAMPIQLNTKDYGLVLLQPETCDPNNTIVNPDDPDSEGIIITYTFQHSSGTKRVDFAHDQNAEQTWLVAVTNIAAAAKESLPRLKLRVFRGEVDSGADYFSTKDLSPTIYATVIGDFNPETDFIAFFRTRSNGHRNSEFYYSDDLEEIKDATAKKFKHPSGHILEQMRIAGNLRTDYKGDPLKYGGFPVEWALQNGQRVYRLLSRSDLNGRHEDGEFLNKSQIKAFNGPGWRKTTKYRVAFGIIRNKGNNARLEYGPKSFITFIFNNGNTPEVNGPFVSGFSITEDYSD